MKVSADALYAVLSTTCGQKLADPKYTKNLSIILHEHAPLKVEYIRPFVHSRCITKNTFSVNMARFRTVMNPENALWTVENDENYVEWIVQVTCSVAECFGESYLESFLPVCRLSVEFCELVLPRILYLLMSIQRCANFDAMRDCVNRFFRYRLSDAQQSYKESLRRFACYSRFNI